MAVAQAPARPRAGGGRIFIIIGLVLALVGFGLAVLLGSLSHVGGGSGATCPCDLVVYAAKDIPLRTQITTVDQIKVKLVPDTFKPAGAIVIDPSNQNKDGGTQNTAALKAVQSFIAEVNIATDQPLMTSMLAKPGDTITGAQAAFLAIPQGYVALTIPTSELIGVAGYPQPGDYIGVIASAGHGLTGISVTVFTQLHIIRIGQAAQNVIAAGSSGNNANGSANPGAVAVSITVLATPCQAELITWFQQNTTVRYELESYKDYAPAATGPDPRCAGLSSAKGVSATDITTAFPIFKPAIT